MNVAFVLRRLPPEGGGTEKQAYLLAESLNLKNNSCLVFGARIHNPPCDNDPSWVYSIPDSPVRFWGTIKFHYCLLRKLNRCKHNIDYIGSFFLNETTLLVLVWSLLNRKKMIYKISDSPPAGAPGHCAGGQAELRIKNLLQTSYFSLRT